jgi:MFS superfamily sulfate permease-like transporter
MLLTIIASIITGTIVGVWLTLVFATTAVSRSQERRQRKVHYWEEQAYQAYLARVAEEHERLTADYRSRR